MISSPLLSSVNIDHFWPRNRKIKKKKKWSDWNLGYLNRFPAINCNYRMRYILVAYVADNMDPDQTASEGAVLSWFIVFASLKK